jgi:GT2 family glycosyltransferase
LIRDTVSDLSSTARVLAVVLTHNAPDAVGRCLAAIDAQTRPPERILVVDNASSVLVSAGSERVPTEVLRIEQNWGPAGGHGAGLARFLTSTFDLAWVMDDDCIPEVDCLARLLAAHGVPQFDGIVFPFWIDSETGEGMFLPAWCGFLIDRATVECLGIPRAEFVWWAEDTEYLQWRVHRAGVRVKYERGARVEHRRVRWLSTRPVWKIYYEVRNTIFFRLYVQRRPFTRFRRMFRSLIKLLGQIVTREDQKIAKLAAYARGFFDGVTRRLGLRMPLS